MDKLQKIKELKQLFNDGVITSSEYENLKNETLNNEDNSISVATINNNPRTPAPASIDTTALSS